MTRTSSIIDGWMNLMRFDVPVNGLNFNEDQMSGCHSQKMAANGGYGDGDGRRDATYHL